MCCVIVYVTHLSPGSCLICPPSGIVNPGGYIMGPPGLHKTQTHVFTWRQQTCQHIWTSCEKSLKWVCFICNQVWKQVYSTVIGLLADLEQSYLDFYFGYSVHWFEWNIFLYEPCEQYNKVKHFTCIWFQLTYIWPVLGGNVGVSIIKRSALFIAG